MTDAVSTAVTPKQQYLNALEQETGITLRVLQALPPDKSELKPSEILKNARELAWMFVVEQGAAMAAIRGEMSFPPAFPPAPENYQEVVAAFEASSNQLRELVESTPDEEFNETTQFYVAPHQLGDLPKLQFLWFMLCDMIHHRGQFSVYVRLAGGKVPSIYGPTAEEPWF